MTDPARATLTLPEIEPDEGDTVASIGEKIRQLRKSKWLTLTDLSASTGISIGHLSQIERGLSVASIRDMLRIAQTLETRVSWLFGESDAPPPSEEPMIVRAPRRRRVRYAGLGMTDYLLSTGLCRSLELTMSYLEPGAESGPAFNHEGEEAGVVLTGTLEFWIGDAHYLLYDGDSFGFPSATPHRYCNPGKTRTTVVWAVTPRGF